MGKQEIFGCLMQRETCQFEKEQNMVKTDFNKALASRFCVTSKSCSWINKIVHDCFISNGLNEKVMIFLLKVD